MLLKIANFQAAVKSEVSARVFARALLEFDCKVFGDTEGANKGLVRAFYLSLPQD